MLSILYFLSLHPWKNLIWLSFIDMPIIKTFNLSAHSTLGELKSANFKEELIM
jgi:hypothetical protein